MFDWLRRLFSRKYEIYDFDLVSIAKEIEKIDKIANTQKLKVEISLKNFSRGWFRKIQGQLIDDNPEIREKYAVKIKFEAYQNLLEFCRRALISKLSVYRTARNYSTGTKSTVSDRELIEVLEIIEDIQRKRDDLLDKSDKGRAQINLIEANRELLSLLELKYITLTNYSKRLKIDPYLSIKRELTKNELRLRDKKEIAQRELIRKRIHEEVEEIKQRFTSKSKIDVKSLFSGDESVKKTLAREKAALAGEVQRIKRDFQSVRRLEAAKGLPIPGNKELAKGKLAVASGIREIESEFVSRNKLRDVAGLLPLEMRKGRKRKKVA